MLAKTSIWLWICRCCKIKETTWKKAASFENLYNTVHTLLEAHSSADVTASSIAKEITMDTGAAFQEAQVVAARKIIDNVFNIANLNPNVFLIISNWKMLEFALTTKLSERFEVLTFFSCVKCDWDSH